MDQYIHKPSRHASYRENSTDPEPGGVRVKREASTGDIIIDISAGIDPVKMVEILTAMIQGLQGDNTGNQTDEVVGEISFTDNKEYDVFVSHATEDKIPLVDDLVRHLEDLGIRVWYDKNNIGWGDSFRKKMDEGLKKARYGIVILSPDYIKEEKYWTKAELDALFQKESITGKKVLLPVWHHLSKNEVMDFSTFIATRNALSTATMTVAEIAIQVRKIIFNRN